MDFVLVDQPWKGEIRPSADPRFAQFDSMIDGCRALAKELLVYHTVHGCNTIRQIINRWAPPVENNTSAYVTDVAADCHVQPDDTVAFDAVSLGALVRAIINHENGDNASLTYVSAMDIQAGCNDACNGQ